MEDQDVHDKSMLDQKISLCVRTEVQTLISRLDDYKQLFTASLEHETTKTQRDLKKYVDTTVQSVKKQIETQL
jgi:hypothetical protein